MTGRRRPRLATVRVRVTLATALVVAAALVIGAVALVAVLRVSLLRSISGSGPTRAAEIAALAGRDARGTLPSPLPAVAASRLTLIQVVGADGRVVASSAALTGAPAVLPPGTRHSRVIHDVPGLGEGLWLAEPTPATIAARPTTIIVVTSLADLTRSARLLGGLMLVAVPLLTAFAALIVWIVVGRSLRPVEVMRAEVETITASHLERRVPVPATEDEIGKLARTLNDMLDRLEEANDRQRRFVADASHELRTPVANIRAAVEVAVAHPERADWPAVAADVLRQDDRMQRLTDDLVTLARTDATDGPMRRERVDLAQLVGQELVRMVPPDRVLEAAGALPSAVVEVDAHQLGRALSNLIDNGLRHASRRVTVGLAVGASWVEIAVTDDGAGIAPADRDRVFERFVRLDDHRSRVREGAGMQTAGAGLGLAITREIVSANGGTVEVVDRGPGATLVLRLPLAVSAFS